MNSVETLSHRISRRKRKGEKAAKVFLGVLLPPITVRVELTRKRIVLSAAGLITDEFQTPATAPYLTPHLLSETLMQWSRSSLMVDGRDFDRLHESIIASRGHLMGDQRDTRVLFRRPTRSTRATEPKTLGARKEASTRREEICDMCRNTLARRARYYGVWSCLTSKLCRRR